MMKKLIVNIAGFKSAPQLSEETLAFTGNLVLDGVKIASLSNRGHGDPVNTRPENPAARERLKELSDFLRSQDKSPDGLQPDLDWFLATLAGIMEDRRLTRRKYAGKTPVQLAGEHYDPYAWSVFGFRHTPENLKRITERHGAITRDLHAELTKPITVGDVLEEMCEPV